jgi:putative CRISPR-associated protein (TIGR02619 family)
MRNTLICTVGTSLFESNLKWLREKAKKFPDTVPNNWKALVEAYESSNWKALAQELLEIKPSERVCGAEINAIEEIRQKKWLSLEKLYFLVSDTPMGTNTGRVLTEYFKQRSDLKLKKNDVAYKTVEKLQDKMPKDFRTHGLRNLVRAIGEYLQRMGGTEKVAIDATGGYKAQIAIAVVIGQALNIPVYYKHERFSEIIDFPPMPVTLDYEILAEHADILTDFERNEVFSASELGEISERLQVFLNEVEIDGEPVYELNAIGQVYLTGFRLRYYQQRVELVKAENRKAPTFGDDHHYPTGFKDFVHKVWEENPWIITSQSISYAKQKAIKGIGFKVIPKGEERRLIGTFQDEKFGARFWIHLAEESPTHLTMAADRLNQKYRK